MNLVFKLIHDFNYASWLSDRHVTFYSGVHSFKYHPSLHVSLSICHNLMVEKNEKLVDLIPKTLSIRQFVEFEAKRSGSILIFPLSSQPRLMRRCLPEPRALPRMSGLAGNQPLSWPLIGPRVSIRPSHWSNLSDKPGDLKIIESCNGKPEYSGFRTPWNTISGGTGRFVHFVF